MTAVIVAFLLTHGWPVPLAILVSLLAAAGIGLLNGLCITRLKMSPFVPDAGDSVNRQKLRADRHSRAADFNLWGRIPIVSLGLGGGDIFGFPNPFIIFLPDWRFLLLDPPFTYSLGSLRLRGRRKRENGAFDRTPRGSTKDHCLYLIRRGRGDRRDRPVQLSLERHRRLRGPVKSLLSLPQPLSAAPI